MKHLEIIKFKRSSLIFLLLILFSISCANNEDTHELRRNFSKKQISELKIINNFFIQSVCGNINNKDFKSCFENKIPYIIEYGLDSIALKIDFNNQKEMYKSISDSTFNEIWGYVKLWKGKDRKTTYKKVGISMQGRYMNYLKDVGRKNIFISEYYEDTFASGGLPFTSKFFYNIYKNPKELDLNDQNIQLIIAVHLLTEMEYIKRDELWDLE